MLVNYFIYFIFFNSSVLNYPKSCAGKKILRGLESLKKKLNSSVLNYPKLCADLKILFYYHMF